MMLRALPFVLAAIVAVPHGTCGMEWSETPGVRRNPGNLTAAKWIWHSGPVLREGEAFSRFAFDVPDDAADAFVRVVMDDGGDWYLNGNRQVGRNLTGVSYRPSWLLNIARNIRSCRPLSLCVPYFHIVVMEWFSWWLISWFWVGGLWLVRCGCRFTVLWRLLHPSVIVIPFFVRTCFHLAADCAFALVPIHFPFVFRPFIVRQR